jgi:hypothetical protein
MSPPSAAAICGSENIVVGIVLDQPPAVLTILFAAKSHAVLKQSDTTDQREKRDKKTFPEGHEEVSERRRRPPRRAAGP